MSDSTTELSIEREENAVLSRIARIKRDAVREGKDADPAHNALADGVIETSESTLSIFKEVKQMPSRTAKEVVKLLNGSLGNNGGGGSFKLGPLHLTTDRARDIGRIIQAITVPIIAIGILLIALHLFGVFGETTEKRIALAVKEHAEMLAEE